MHEQLLCYQHSVHDDLLSAYLHSLRGHSLNRILDIGCGSGRNLLFLAKMGHLMTGVENKREKLERIEAIGRRGIAFFCFSRGLGDLQLF